MTDTRDKLTKFIQVFDYLSPCVDSKWRFEQQEQRSRDASSLDRRQFPQQDSGDVEKVSTQEKSRTYVEFDSCNTLIYSSNNFLGDPS